MLIERNICGEQNSKMCFAVGPLESSFDLIAKLTYQKGFENSALLL